MDLTLFPKLFKRLSYSAGNNRNSIHPSTHPSSHYPSFHREKLWLHPGRKQTKTVFAAVDSNVWKLVWCLMFFCLVCIWRNQEKNPRQTQRRTGNRPWGKSWAEGLKFVCLRLVISCFTRLFLSSLSAFQRCVFQSFLKMWISWLLFFLRFCSSAWWVWIFRLWSLCWLELKFSLCQYICSLCPLCYTVWVPGSLIYNIYVLI